MKRFKNAHLAKNEAILLLDDDMAPSQELLDKLPKKEPELLYSCGTILTTVVQALHWDPLQSPVPLIKLTRAQGHEPLRSK